MTIIHNLGYPRIGASRQLKFALESYWKGEITQEELKATGAKLRFLNWETQSQLDLIPVGDFSFYDQVLDMSFMLGNIPKRVSEINDTELDNYFRIARGRSVKKQACCEVQAGEMTKWFNTNYHYIVPEFSRETEFNPNFDNLLSQINEISYKKIKPVIIGPLTYLALGKIKDNTNKYQLLDKLIPVYKQLLIELSEKGIEWVQIDEPILVTELDEKNSEAFIKTYNKLNTSNIKILLATYFGELKENLSIIKNLPVQGIHLDIVNTRANLNQVIEQLPVDLVISLGVINGRNIWKTDINKILTWLVPLHKKIGNRLWLAPSCSLLHVPVDLDNELTLNPEIKSWMAFAKQKLSELALIAKALNHGLESVKEELAENKKIIEARKNSKLANNPKVQQELALIQLNDYDRKSDYAVRSKLQKETIKLPLLPTTTIGSFPQTKEIRSIRQAFKAGNLDANIYKSKIKNEIELCIKKQEELGLDVLVHGEAERNDMVEYFGEQLQGYVFSQHGWVQSYGSRCVKPPIIYGDIRRDTPMTIEWIQYAQSLTDKPVKGMLTGPVTMLNWSFVRDDQLHSETCKQLALAIRQEVKDLENAGVNIIQIDEAALREGMPLRKQEWKEYLQWAINSFKLAANGVQDHIQIHTHMCYSEFNDIIDSIVKMDADVITIETSRSDMKLLDVFEDFKYPNEIGPGVYDIHSPNIPNKLEIINLLTKATNLIPIEKLWVNPDCGLKTREWSEVLPALQIMVDATKALRNSIKLQ